MPTTGEGPVPGPRTALSADWVNLELRNLRRSSRPVAHEPPFGLYSTGRGGAAMTRDGLPGVGPGERYLRPISPFVIR
jgi:hypothetical protein